MPLVFWRDCLFCVNLVFVICLLSHLLCDQGFSNAFTKFASVDSLIVSDRKCMCLELCHCRDLRSTVDSWFGDELSCHEDVSLANESFGCGSSDFEFAIDSALFPIDYQVELVSKFDVECD